jgi:hypothetical protein
MKKIIITINFLVFINIFSAIAADFYAIRSGNWNNESTWDNGSIPTANDNVYINSGITVNITNNPYCQNLYMLGGTINFSNGNRTLTINNNLYIESGNNQIIGGGSGNRYLQINGDLKINANSSLSLNDHSITVNGETFIQGKLTFNDNKGDKIFNNINITSSGILECTTNVDITIKGDLKNDGTFIPNDGTYTFSGTNEQNISSISAISFYNLTINNSVRVKLNNNVIVKNHLNMTNGNIIMDVADTLTLGISPTQRGALTRTNGTIVGNFRRWFDTQSSTAQNILFPVGTMNYYRPLIIRFTSALSSSGTLTATFIENDPEIKNMPINDMGVSLSYYGTDGYWQLTPDNGLAGGTYNLNLYITGFQYIYNGADISNLRMIKQNINSTQWIADGSHQASTWSNGYPIINRNGLTGFGKYALAGTPNSPLPIELLYFNATTINKEVKLSWATASEINNDFFTIEYSNSLDNEDILWTPIATIDGAGNSNTTLTYEYIDKPYMRDDKANVIFYRLKQTDFDGKYKYYGPIYVRFTNTNDNDKNINVYYDPSTNENAIKIVFNSTELNQYQINIFDINGKLVATDSGQSIEGTNSVTIDINNINSSIFIIVLNNGSQVFSQKVVITK